MRACSTACWRGSAGPRWSAPPPSLRPGHSTGRRNDRPMLRLLSLALLFAAWLIGSTLAGPQMLPGPGAVAQTILTEARSGALFLNLGATLARVALAFALAMTLGAALGIVM